MPDVVEIGTRFGKVSMLQPIGRVMGPPRSTWRNSPSQLAYHRSVAFAIHPIRWFVRSKDRRP
jgi:hypothetical protein